MTEASRMTVAFLLGFIIAGLGGFILGENWRYPGGVPPSVPVVQSPPSPAAAPVQAVKPNDDDFKEVAQWTDVSDWSAKNLQVELESEPSPSGAKAVHLIENDQNIWRNISVVVPKPVARNRPIKLTAEIKLDSENRQAVLMAYGDHDRIACNLRQGGITSTLDLGGAKVGPCTSSQLANGWWAVSVTGSLRESDAGGPVFVAVAITADAFREDYQGDGHSGLSVGKISFAQPDGDK